MTEHYTAEIERSTTMLIQQRFHVPEAHAKRLAVAALNGIESRGGNPNNWDSVTETVKVVVAAWINNGNLL